MVIRRHVTLGGVMLCHVVLWVLCDVISCNVVIFVVMWCCVAICGVMWRYVALCGVV